MSYIKTFTNIKIAGNAGPQSLGASQVFTSSPVPCKGASMIIFRLKATDSNGLAAGSVNAGNEPTGVGLQTALSLGIVASSSALVNMSRAGGISVAFVPPTSFPRFIWDYIQFAGTANAAGHTAFQVDVDVVYPGDVDDNRQSFGQINASPV